MASDLLAELKAERAKHTHVPTPIGPGHCRLNYCGEWPCPLSRALDGMIAGVEALQRIQLIAFNNRYSTGVQHAEAAHGQILGITKEKAMARAWRGEHGEE